LSVHGLEGVRQTKMHIAEPLIPESSESFWVEIATGQLKRYKSPGTDQIHAKLFQAETLNSKI